MCNGFWNQNQGGNLETGLKYGAWAQEWESTSRDYYGTEPDGVYYYPTEDVAKAETEERLKQTLEVEKDLYGKRIPDEYTRPVGPPYLTPVSDEISRDIKELGFAFRLKKESLV